MTVSLVFVHTRMKYVRAWSTHNQARPPKTFARQGHQVVDGSAPGDVVLCGKKAENVAFEKVIEAQIEAATIEEPDLFFNSVCAVAGPKSDVSRIWRIRFFLRHGLFVRCERGSKVALPSCLSPRTTLVAVKHEDGRDDHCNIDRVRFRSFDWTA